ncbi:hypothetical protein NVIE_2200 [Nitrososphaera viennensis EN76]|uniref:Uncharacterized protein n=1 Tax=Nitrososphaera viennensis EN76 TaxID=926571 RepID=A0A060HIN6_9ARCH|nr:hypothetical protein NVIE_2200 [Nitrososphaera viennensis EN76]
MYLNLKNLPKPQESSCPPHKIETELSGEPPSPEPRKLAIHVRQKSYSAFAERTQPARNH